MNGNDLMRVMNGINEKFLIESENYAPNRRKTKRGIFKAAVSIAAAAAVAVPVGVYAYNAFVHRETVEQYISNAELIEQNSPDAVKNTVTENNDYRITVDSVLSDGNMVMMILTHEALTEKGAEIKDHVYGCPGACITYADGSPGPFESRGAGGVPMTGPVCGYAVGDETEFNGYDKTVSLFTCKDIDLSKDVKIEFYSGEHGWSGALEYFVNRNDPDYRGYDGLTNELDGLDFTTSFAQNVECVLLQNSDGKCISMSSFEVYTSDPSMISSVEDTFFDFEKFFLITNDGERKPLDKRWYSSGTGVDYGFVLYGEFIDINEYNGVEINGTEYLKF